MVRTPPEVESLTGRAATRDMPAPALLPDLLVPLPIRDRAEETPACGAYVIAAARLPELEPVTAAEREAPMLVLLKEERELPILEDEETEEDLLPKLEDGPARTAWVAVAINIAATTYRIRVISVGNGRTARV